MNKKSKTNLEKLKDSVDYIEFDDFGKIGFMRGKLKAKDLKRKKK